nr:copia protein [Tanacetum cinerariifolium]
METMNLSFDELSAMAFKQRSSKPGLQSMTSGQINSGLDLTYALSTITTQQPTEGELDLLFKAMYDDYVGGQPSSAPRTIPAAQAHQVPSTMEPKNVKEAMTDPAWIESMQEELLQFKRLDVWVLVPALDNITPITLKWLFKNKHDEEKMVIENKSRLVVRGYRQEEGIDFKESFALAKPTEKHLKEVKRIFRYLYGTVNTGLWYTKDSGFELTGFSDADYAGCKDTFKSTSDGAQFLGEKLVSWSLKKQDCMALSIAEAEYVSISACYAQVLWMRTQLTDYGFHFNKIPIYCDSKSAIAISCNPTDYQLADLFTKALPVDRFNYLVHRLGTLPYKRWTREDGMDVPHTLLIWPRQRRHFLDAVASYGFFGSSNLTADPDAVSMIQTASHLSPDAVRIIQMASLEKRLVRFDELYKFSNGTLQSVRDILHDMATNLRMEYNKAMPKRRWSHLNKTRSHIMVKEIDHELRERRLMRSLEKFAGGKHYEEDLRLLQRTI